jgi:hypothetical protein
MNTSWRSTSANHASHSWEVFTWHVPTTHFIRWVTMLNPLVINKKFGGISYNIKKLKISKSKDFGFSIVAQGNIFW